VGQRVNIQYSIEIKELEGEVLRLLERSKELLQETAQDFVLPTSSLSISGLDYIEEVRKKLLEVDVSLGDISRIIGGYISYRAPAIQAPPPEVEPEIETDVPRTDPDPMVQDIINRFREVATPHEEPS